jgi:hypothetical protein
MKAYVGVDIQIHIFLTSALLGGEWSASRLCRCTPRERTPGIHWIVGWVGPRARLDDVEKKKFLTLRGLEPWPHDHPARSQSLITQIYYKWYRIAQILLRKDVHLIYFMKNKWLCEEHLSLELREPKDCTAGFVSNHNHHYRHYD